MMHYSFCNETANVVTPPLLAADMLPSARSMIPFAIDSPKP